MEWSQLTRCDRLKLDLDGRGKVKRFLYQQTLPVGNQAESTSAASYLIILIHGGILLAYFTRIL